ncbi:hypothetical protein BELL_1197g00020 [Botrytis elliptica]|uniref:Uncharacterized protein n=1 Tax=Botrytis elliptica TaxID=278938 RepID=A0A4Z1IGM0_9HELO|nr:hypothetical protein BELL_1197g00020 [Botrytis elliptica]
MRKTRRDSAYTNQRCENLFIYVSSGTGEIFRGRVGEMGRGTVGADEAGAGGEDEGVHGGGEGVVVYD